MLLALLLVTPVMAQEVQPTFRASTRLVQVDVIARSKGAPAADLTRDDFNVFDNGKRQTIAFFAVRSAQASGTAVPPPLGAVSNRLDRDGASVGHVTVLLIDQKNTSQIAQAFAIQGVIRFVAARHGNDRIAIYRFLRDGSVHIVQELTDNSQLLNRAANSLKAQDPNQRSADTDGMTAHAAEEFRSMTLIELATDTKNALKAVARHLASVPGRKSLIWVTTAFPLVTRDLDFNPDMDQAARALNDANVALYAVDSRALIGALSGMTAISNAETAGPPASPRAITMLMQRGAPPNPSGLNTMQKLAGLTGGLVFLTIPMPSTSRSRPRRRTATSLTCWVFIPWTKGATGRGTA